MNSTPIVAVALVAITATAACEGVQPPVDQATAPIAIEQNEGLDDSTLSHHEVGASAHADRPDRAIDAVTPADAPETAALQNPDADERTPSRKAMTAAGRVQSHGRWVRDLLAASPARVTVNDGEIKWRLERGSDPQAGAFLVAEVTAQRACGAPKKLRVRVPHHSELPNLQPRDGRSLLFFGSYAGGVMNAKWAAPYNGRTLAVHHVEIPLTTDDLFATCS